MKTIEYWEVCESFDRDSRHIANFTNKADAEACAKGVYRSAYKKSITIFDSLEDYEENTRERIRERALAKLSTEEKIALGLKTC